MANLPQIETLRTPDASASRALARRRFPRINLPFLLIIALLVSYGLAVVYSAVSTDADYSFTRQLAGVAVGVLSFPFLQLQKQIHVNRALLPLYIQIHSPPIPFLNHKSPLKSPYSCRSQYPLRL